MASFATPAAILLLLLFCSPFLAAADDVSYVGKSGLFTLLDCGGGASSSDGGDSAAAPPSIKNESADVISELLAAIPSVEAPEGFGALSRGGASVRGVCVGESSPESCRACLIDAAWSLTKGCGLSLRRAGAWTNNCFVAYAYAAGTNATAASIAGGRKVLCHGDFNGLYVDGGEDTVFRYAAFPEQTLSSLATDLARRAAGDRARMAAAGEASDRPGETVRAVAQCARDRAEADCLRCLQASARQAAAATGPGGCRAATSSPTAATSASPSPPRRRPVPPCSAGSSPALWPWRRSISTAS
ncbi:unnamed protein product [Urochloa humidicola]